jgi:hypothetical protein
VKAPALFQELAQNVPDNARVHEGLRNAFGKLGNREYCNSIIPSNG